MTPRSQPIRLGRVILMSILFACLGFLAILQLQKTEWYKDRLYQKLVTGDDTDRWPAALGLARVGAEKQLLAGIKSSQPEVREMSRRALEHLWFVASGATAYRLTEKAHEAMTAEDYAGALEILDDLTKRYPHYAEGWNRRASLYWQVGEYEKSMADCRRALELNPHHYGAWQGIGVCQLNLGDIDAAVRALRAALKILPHDEVTRSSLKKCEDLLRTFPSPDMHDNQYQLL